MPRTPSVVFNIARRAVGLEAEDVAVGQVRVFSEYFGIT